MTQRGFSLNELLIVMVILAILGTVGMVFYSGINSKARNSARKADVYEIATALEVNKTLQGYISLQTSQFSSFQWKDPQGNVYCVAAPGVADPSVSEAWGDSCPSGFQAVAPGVPAGVFSSWKVCSFLEDVGANVFCRASRQ